jgi:hypothetical protein
MKPVQRVGMQEATCPECGQTARPQLEHNINPTDALAAHRLSELGIPPYDVVRVATEQGDLAFLLAADRAAVMGFDPANTDRPLADATNDERQ